MFTYSLLPHSGDWREAGTVTEAYSLNQPAEALVLPPQEGALPETFSFASCNKENVVLETLKQADDGSGTILRLYDAFDRRSRPTIRFGVPVKQVWLCDMLENEEQEIAVNDNTVTLDLKNFEILTLKIR